MNITATEVFDWLERVDELSIERIEVTSAAFGTLRHSLRSIVRTLLESDDPGAVDTCDELRLAVSGWLTSPVSFDHALRDSVRVLGDVGDVEERWGRDLRDWYESALRAADALAGQDNPLALELISSIKKVRERGQDFRIYCNRWAKVHFEGLVASMGDAVLAEAKFLHSVKDYRETRPFDVLIKVGPLRTRGWGALPDAVVTAPRYSTLLYLVWEGCADDPEFGYDPAEATNTSSASSDLSSPGLPVKRSSRFAGHTGEDSSPVLGKYVPEDDEFRVFSSPRATRERWRSSTLVQIDEVHGLLYPRLAKVLSFNPSPASSEPLKRRVPGVTLAEGTFLVRPVLDDVDFGQIHASHGYYSRIWKSQLMEEFLRDADGLINRLTKSGLDLLRLRSAVHNWLKPPTTVIHAPQQRRHFKVLIESLKVEFTWERAWREVQRSRGIAIQAGVQEQDIVENELLVILAEMLESVRALSEPGESFSLSLPMGTELRGTVMFDAVQSIESGFYVPEGELKQVIELSRCEQWRA